MGSFSDNFETNLLKLLFNNTTLAKLGDATGAVGSTAAGNLYVRLCTTTPTDSTLGTETTYTGYVAKGVAVPRTTGGWTISGNNASNAALVTFGTQTALTPTITSFEIWLDNVSAVIAERVAWAVLDNNIVIGSGSIPEFAIGALDVNLD